MTRDDDLVTEQLELAADRFDFLNALDGARLDKRDLTEVLPYSRSTVDRAIRDLTAAGFVLDDGDYTTSLKGGQFISLFRATRDAAADVLELDSFVAGAAADYPLPVEAVVGGDELRTDPRVSHPFDALGNRLKATNNGTFVLPYLPSQTFVDRCTTWLVDGHSCRFVAPNSVVTAIWRAYPAFLETVQTVPDCELRVGEVPRSPSRRRRSTGRPTRWWSPTTTTRAHAASSRTRASAPWRGPGAACSRFGKPRARSTSTETPTVTLPKPKPTSRTPKRAMRTPKRRRPAPGT
ncbi:hypothetical protein [Haloferax sp. Atlit-4N]|uniref:hypothetical protein n=1 Tax=Haloferax sp. Atlit-4N TaxID=2077206 RepID=UPI001F479A8D|nr:hypothetical protein [Haloferax sp. Atlit-4N]